MIVTIYDQTSKQLFDNIKYSECRQACLPLTQFFFGFASDIDQTNIKRDIRDGNWLSNILQSFMERNDLEN